MAKRKGFGNMGMGGMMKQFQQISKNVQKVQDSFKEMEIEGSAGGGAIKIVATCDYIVKDVTIAKEVVDPEDVEMLQDLVQAAISDLLEKIEARREEEVKNATGGMNLPINI